jgi:hypothetical protein
MEAATRPAPDRQRKNGFFEGLMDTRFDTLITPKLVSFLYVVSMVVVTLLTIGFVIAGFADGGATAVLFLILAPILGLIYLIMIRLYLELIVVAFKIRDAAEEVAVNTRRA